jgi:hypothetical protein
LTLHAERGRPVESNRQFSLLKAATSLTLKPLGTRSYKSDQHQRTKSDAQWRSDVVAVADRLAVAAERGAGCFAVVGYAFGTFERRRVDDERMVRKGRRGGRASERKNVEGRGGEERGGRKRMAIISEEREREEREDVLRTVRSMAWSLMTQMASEKASTPVWERREQGGLRKATRPRTRRGRTFEHEKPRPRSTEVRYGVEELEKSEWASQGISISLVELRRAAWVRLTVM